MANKKPKFKATANPLASQAAAERAFSGSWGTHLDGRNRRARTRLASKARAIRDAA